MLAVIIFTTALALIKPVARLPQQVFIDYNEGWMAYFSQYAIGDKPLYQTLDAFILNNYPPLSFYICGIAGEAFGDIIIAGRWISLFGFFLTAVMISLIIRRFSGSVYLSIAGGALFVGYMAVYHTGYVAMNDPQWLAHGLMMSGFTLFLYKEENNVLFLGSMLLMLLAGLTKHNLLPVPAAITVWLFINDRRRFYHWFVGGLFLTAITLLMMFAAYGENFFLDILMAPRTYYIGKIANVIAWLTPALIYILAVLMLFIYFFKDRHIQLILLYSTISLLWGAIAAGGGGVYYNVIFDFTISLFIGAFLFAERAPEILKGRISRGRVSTTIAILIFFLPLMLAAPQRLHSTIEFLQNRSRIERQIEEDIAFVANYPEPVMCENLALSYWAGKNFSFDFFTTGQKLKTGIIPVKNVTDRLDHREFSLIQLNDKKGDTYHLPEVITEKIFKNYPPIKQSKVSGMFLAPLRNSE